MIRALNFLMIFLVCLALVLFSLQNTESASIQLLQGVQVQAPICIELIVAMGVGAILAWFFSLWTRLQRAMISRKEIRVVRQKDERIQELEQKIERYQAEIQEPQQLPPSAATQTEAIPATELLANKI